MSETPILIIGAGPSGLMMACQCARYSVPFRIIDRKSCPTKESRALVVHTRPQEVYDQLGLCQRAIEKGHAFYGFGVNVEGQLRVVVQIGDIGKGKTQFPAPLTLEQSKNEELLVSYLEEHGHNVDWETGFESMQTFDTHCMVTVKKASGEKEVIRADWVVACDGASSPVRHALNVPFGGGTYKNTFYVADVDVRDSPLPRDFGSGFFSKEGFGLAFPMEGSPCRFRLVGVVPSEAYENPGWIENKDFDVIRQAFSRIMRSKLNIQDPNWFATYYVHHRKVNSFRVGRVFLVGDAAHVHSPAGGQGMNTGLLDAHNLGWKLAYHVQGKADEAILDTYNSEREPFAVSLLRTTDNMFRFLSGGGLLVNLLRMWLLPAFLSMLFYFRSGREFFYGLVSQTGISYPQSKLSGTAMGRSRIKAGDRFPAFSLKADGKSFDWSLELFREIGFYALDFTQQREESRRSMLEKLSRRFGVPVHYRECEVSKAESQDDPGIDNDFFLVRPDMYVGFISSSPSEEALVEYFINHVGLKST